MEKSQIIGTAWLWQLQMPDGDEIFVAHSTNEARMIAAELQDCETSEVFGLKTLQPSTKVTSKTKIRTLRYKVSHLLPEHRPENAEGATPQRRKRRKTRTGSQIARDPV